MVLASDLVTSKIIQVGGESKISEAFSLMLKNKEKNLVIFLDGSYFGILTQRELIKRKRIYSEAKVKTIADTKVPSISEKDDLLKIASLMYHSNARILPVFRGGTLVGFVRVEDILAKALEDEDLARKELKALSSEAITLNEDDNLAKVLSVMRKNEIKQVPIVDRENNCIGVITLEGLIEKYFIHEDPKRGLFSLTGHEPEAKKILKVRLRDIVEEAKSFRPTQKVADAKSELVKSDSILLVDDKKVKGIVTTKDLLRAIISLGKEGVKIQLSNMPPLTKPDEERALRKINMMYEKLSRILPGEFSLAIHFKSCKKQGMRVKHSVKAKVSCGNISLNAFSESWNFLTALEDCLDLLFKEALKKGKQERLKKRV
ncbi:MAG: CBS domain-containing protein [Candidatus Diapherotrites archaeon]